MSAEVQASGSESKMFQLSKTANESKCGPRSHCLEQYLKTMHIHIDMYARVPFKIVCRHLESHYDLFDKLCGTPVYVPRQAEVSSLPSVCMQNSKIAILSELE